MSTACNRHRDVKILMYTCICACAGRVIRVRVGSDSAVDFIWNNRLRLLLRLPRHHHIPDSVRCRDRDAPENASTSAIEFATALCSSGPIAVLEGVHHTPSAYTPSRSTRRLNRASTSHKLGVSLYSCIRTAQHAIRLGT